MKITGIVIKAVSLGVISAIVLSFAACDKKLSSDTDVTSSSSSSSVQETSLDPMSFEAVDARLRDYTFDINEYMKDHAAEATVKKTDGTTVCGVAANCTYTISPDGQYESLQMQKNIAGGIQIDEYFNLGDALFIARTTVYDDGNFDPVDKYYIIDGALYKVDGSASTVTKIIDISDPSAGDTKTELDIYFTFEEIRAIYA